MTNEEWQQAQFNKVARDGMNPNTISGRDNGTRYDYYRKGKTVVPYGTTPKGWNEVGMGYRQAAPLAAAAAQEKARVEAAIAEQARLDYEAQMREHDAGYANTGDARQFQGKQLFGVPEITYGAPTPELVAPETIAPNINSWFSSPEVLYK